MGGASNANGGVGGQAVSGASTSGTGGSAPGGSGAGGTAGGEATTAGGAAGSGGSNAGGSNAGTGGTGGAPVTFDPIEGKPFDEMPLYSGDPPNFKADAKPETVSADGHIYEVSIPTLRRFPMDASKATGFGYLVFPGGGYAHLDMGHHATALADRLGPLGIAVFALKYRCSSGTTDAPRDALIDAKRALRLLRANASHWGVVVEHLGIIGYSAGSHLALNVAANFDDGKPQDADPIERQSSRPAFVGSMSTWSFGQKVSPFTFPQNVPPAYFCHAKDDTTAPIELPTAVEQQIRAQGVATQLDFYDTGGHSTCHPGEPTMAGHDWPLKFWPWVQAAVE